MPYPITEAKQWKKDAKKLLSIQKKVTTLQGKYDLWREKYAKQSKTNKKKEQEYLAKARKLRNDIRLQKQEKNMFRNMFWLLKKKIGAEWKPLYSSDTMQQVNFLYDYLVFSGNSPTLRV